MCLQINADKFHKLFCDLKLFGYRTDVEVSSYFHVAEPSILKVEEGQKYYTYVFINVKSVEICSCQGNILLYCASF